MQELELWISFGLQHIIDLNGYDHMLFLACISSLFLYSDFKLIAWQVTAFTLGHAISLCLSSLNFISISSAYIEFFIPITILISASYNLNSITPQKSNYKFRYTIVFFFGLIHGLGFSIFLKSLLGKSEQIFIEILGFNIGLEIGQLVFVFLFFCVQYILIKTVKISLKNFQLGINIIVLLVSIYMAYSRIPF